MNRCPARDHLQRYLARELTPADHADLAAHLVACPACRDACAHLAPDPEPAPLPTADDTAQDHVLVGDAPTCRLWQQDQAPRPGERPVQAPGFEWSYEAEPADAVPVIPDYEVLGELGRGGMGVVYLARQVHLNRLVALKMILASELADPENLVRFRTEAEAVARLQHPNIVQVYEVGTAQGLPYCALEYVGGGNLAQCLARAAQPPIAAAMLIEVLARAIHYAHERGVIHRDLKPANILSTKSQIPNSKPPTDSTPDWDLEFGIWESSPKVTDFGLAKYTAAAAPHGPGGSTRPGLVLGTPQYMAPEQADGGGPVGPAVDVYSLGAILYELLAGRPPFQGGNPLDTLLRRRILDPVAPRVWQPKVPRDLETIALKCLAKEPRRRYASAAALANDLRRFLDGKPITARQTGPSEHVWKWIRRHPTVTALGVTAAVTVLFGFGGITWKWQQAEARRAVAEVALHAAESELYLSRIAQAHGHCLAGRTDRAAELLDLCRPDRRQWEWYYLNRLCRPGPAGRTGPVPEVRFADDADVRADDVAATLCGPSKPLAAAFSPNGRRLAAVGPDGALRLWDVATWQEVLALPAPAVLRLAFSADGTVVAARLADGGVAVWDARPLDQ